MNEGSAVEEVSRSIESLKKKSEMLSENYSRHNFTEQMWQVIRRHRDEDVARELLGRAFKLAYESGFLQGVGER